VIGEEKDASDAAIGFSFCRRSIPASHEADSVYFGECLAFQTVWISIMTTVDDTLEVMIQRIVSGFQPERIILFGSYARGDANPSSDIDLLVVMPDGTDRRQAAIAMKEALDDVRVPKDVIVTTPDLITRHGHLVGTILRPALREGKELYARR
jgi:predicted nucleotidyltransferase